MMVMDDPLYIDVKSKVLRRKLSVPSVQLLGNNAAFAIMNPKHVSPATVAQVVQTVTDGAGRFPVYDATLDRLRSAEYFNFTELDFDVLHSEALRAEELIALGLLRLPYTNTIFNIVATEQNANAKDGYFVIASQNETLIEMIMYRVTLESTALNRSFLTAFAWIRIDTRAIRRGEPGNAGSPLLVSQRWVGHPDSGEKILNEEMTRTVQSVFAALLILNTKKVEASQSPDSKAWQGITRSGDKPCLVTTVKAGEYFRALNESTARAGPRPHLRRGHIRRLASGEQTWVRDCVVGAVMSDKGTTLDYIPRTEYKVKGPVCRNVSESVKQLPSVDKGRSLFSRLRRVFQRQ